MSVGVPPRRSHVRKILGRGPEGRFAYLPCSGDIDGDGDLLRAWASQPGDPNWNENADLDGNGEVGQGDVGIFLADWGCGS